MRRALLVLSAALAAACGEPRTSAPPALGTTRDLALVASGDLAPGAPLGSETRQLAVAAGAGSWLVVWSRPGLAGEDLVGLRVAPSGAPLDAAPFVISAASGDEQSPAVAFDGSGWLVVWQDHRVGPLMNVYAARVAQDGTVLDPAGIPVCTQDDHQRSPAVAFVDGVFVVVWQDRRAGTSWDVYGARVSTDGAVLDPAGFPIATGSGHQLAPAVAAGGGVALAVWQDALLDASIQAARIDPDGAALVSAPRAVSSAAFLQAAPAVTFDGAAFVVAWQDEPTFLAPDVRAARLTPAGELLDASGLPVATGPLAERAPAVGFDGRHVVAAWASGASGAAALLGARLDGAGALQDDPPFEIATGAVGRSLALAADGDGRVLVVHDALDGLGGVTLRGRVLTTWARLEVVRAGRGGGAVVSDPAGVDCGAACSAVYDGGATVTLVAAADADSAFGGWSGACAGTGPCTVTMDAARQVTATFLPLLAVDVAVAGAGGAVTSDPAGVACPGACSARFPEGAVVTLLPAATKGVSVFGAWSEDCSGEGPCTVVVDAPKRATASFVAARTLTLIPSGAGRGTLDVSGATCAAGGVCAVDLALGSTEVVTAVPDAASILKTWSGCVSTSGPACTVSMSVSRTVTARFEPSTYALTVSNLGANEGAGTVTGPAGLACTTGVADGCRADVENPPFTPSYAVAALRAAAAAGSVFKGWSGCTTVAGDPASCTTSMPSAKWVTARFEGATLPLSGMVTGTGAGTITGAGLACGSGGGAGCKAAVENPALATYPTVTLRAVPADGSVFKAWTGCSPVAGDPAACTLVVNGPRFVSAKFEPARLPLNASTTGAGTGAIAGAGLSCSTGSTAGCTAQVDNPANVSGYTTVSLRATAAAGSVFKAWTSCSPVAGDPRACTLLVNGAKWLSARFEPSAFALTVMFSGGGAGNVSGDGLEGCASSAGTCSGAVPNPADTTAYTTITLRAAPAAGSVFKSWAGCSPVAGDPAACTSLVSAARWVTARFEPASYPVTVYNGGLGEGSVAGPTSSCAVGSSGCTLDVANPANAAGYATATLRAEPAAGSVFKAWTGCTPVAGEPRSCTLLVSGPKSPTVKFEPDQFALTAMFSGTGAGRVVGAGLACQTGSAEGCTAAVANTPDTSAYATVTLRAEPLAGNVFKGWSGCAAVPGDPAACTVAANGAKSVVARFEPDRYVVTVFGTGGGAGTVSAAGITCPIATGCTFTVENPPNTTAYGALTLSATPDGASVFKGWVACRALSDPATCVVDVDAAEYVTARFEPATFPLQILVGGSGAVSGGGLSCSAASPDGCGGTFENGASVRLVAEPASGWLLKSWQGCTPAADGSCTASMTAVRYVTATFQPTTYALSLGFTGTGAGAIAAGDAVCASSGGDCTLPLANGATVTLVPTAEPGSTFTGWSGSCYGTGACTVWMTAARTVRANFSSP